MRQRAPTGASGRALAADRAILNRVGRLIMVEYSGASIAVGDLPVEDLSMIGKTIPHSGIIERQVQGGMGEVFPAQILHRKEACLCSRD
jgi:hypothetical protein